MRTLPLVPAFKEKLLSHKSQQEEYAGYAVGAMTSVIWTTFAWMRWAL